MSTRPLERGTTTRPAWFYLGGWIGIAVFGAIVAASHGSDELPFAAVLAVVAIAMCAWFRASSGRAAVVVGLALGVVLSVQQLAYLASDVGSGDGLGVTLQDAFGLVAAASIVVGAGLVLASRRH